MPRKPPESDQSLSIDQAREKIGAAVRDLLTDKDPGTLSFRIQRNKTPSEMYPLKLTWHQRESLIKCTRIKNQLKKRLQELGEGTQVLLVTRKELDHLHGEIGQAAVYAPHRYKKRLVAVLHRVGELFAPDHQGLISAEAPQSRKRAPKQGRLLYQFQITLLDIDPAIWRRIQVPDGTLADLHNHIQAAFGWENCHLHQFEIDGERYGPLGPEDFDFSDDLLDEADVRLSALIPQSGRRSRWMYEYDFGDSWRHEVVFEGFPPADPKAKYPRCVDGARACPPEDCGGPWGYADYLAALADPEHEEHDDLLEWGGPFDPEAFDAKRATRMMRKRG